MINSLWGLGLPGELNSFTQSWSIYSFANRQQAAVTWGNSTGRNFIQVLFCVVFHTCFYWLLLQCMTLKFCLLRGYTNYFLFSRGKMCLALNFSCSNKCPTDCCPCNESQHNWHCTAVISCDQLWSRVKCA